MNYEIQPWGGTEGLERCNRTGSILLENACISSLVDIRMHVGVYECQLGSKVIPFDTHIECSTTEYDKIETHR